MNKSLGTESQTTTFRVRFSRTFHELSFSCELFTIGRVITLSQYFRLQ